MYVMMEPLLGVSQVTTCDLEVRRVVTTKVKIEAKMVEAPTFCEWVCPVLVGKRDRHSRYRDKRIFWGLWRIRAQTTTITAIYE